MAKKDCPAIWKGITVGTQNAIVRNVHKAVVKEGMIISEVEVRADLEKGGGLAQDYWGGYLSRFDPKTVLEESRWTIGEFKNDRGEIIVDSRGRTGVRGVFAAGDCTDTHDKQIVISVGEGAKAALAAFEYLVAQV